MKLVNVEQVVADPLSRKMKLVVNVEPKDKQAVIDLVKRSTRGNGNIPFPWIQSNGSAAFRQMLMPGF